MCCHEEIIIDVESLLLSPAACQCHTNGSVIEVCNKETGQCQCKENAVGRQCDECMVSVF